MGEFADKILLYYHVLYMICHS